MLRKILALTALSLSLPLSAAEIAIDIQVPQLDVAEYHRPYVAVWIEQNNRHVADLTVWYDLKMKDNEGEKWLKDMRQWWRKSGRNLSFPVDGVSAATRPVGTHTLNFKADNPALKQLAAGEYQLLVEAAREVGGRELVKVPFTWPPTAEQNLTAQGNSELGNIQLTLLP